MTPQTDLSDILHASCVAYANQAILIIGPSGSGKSALALELMSRGGVLVADDRTRIFIEQDELFASCPDTIKGQIEARYVGILNAESISNVRVGLVIDLGIQENQRLPPERTTLVLKHSVPLLHSVVGTHFPAAILQYIKAGRIA